MFHHRSSAFDSGVTAIQRHLGAVEQELEKIGRIAGRRGFVAASAASEQIGDTISSIFGDMLERFRWGGRAARDKAAHLGNSANDLGRSYGNRALARVSAQVEETPLLTLGVALGIGVLIGAAVLGSVKGDNTPKRRSKRH
jgi:ElaB/YqjD/DUF883 family membrane-anchored ribosome-binding protein